MKYVMRGGWVGKGEGGGGGGGGGGSPIIYMMSM